MKSINYLSALIGLVCIMNTAHAQEYIKYVDPHIGSGGHGHVFVGANVPFGAVQVGPSNFFKGWDWCSGYNYQDSMIIGFPQLHLSGTGIGDLGDVLIMPYMGDIKLKKGIEKERFSGYASQYAKKNEEVSPGYYSVKLDDYGIDVKLTATERVGFHCYHFPEGKNARIIIDLEDGINDTSTNTYIELVDKNTIKGYRSSSGWAKKQQVFFAIQSSVVLDNFAIYDSTTIVKGKKGKGLKIKGLISFENSPGQVSLKVGISPVSSDNALANIRAEIPAWDFDNVRKQAENKWEKELAKIRIETDNEADKKIFYTAMYHSMMHPSLFNDHNNDYMGADWKVYKKAPFNNYTIFSLWDTYRAAHPLYTITNPDRVEDFVNSMLAIFDQTDALPIWHLRGYDTGTMVGINSFQVIAEAWLKGCKGFDVERAYHAMKTTAMSDLRGLNFVRDLKPIPSDVMRNRPVSTALEYAIGDASIAAMAKKLGKTEDYDYFWKRAQNYKLYYDKDVNFIHGKMADGRWNPVFDPLKSVRPYATDYAEGNAWQYLWLAPQDVTGLVEMLGGEEIFTDRLDTFFSLTTDKTDPDVLIDLTGSIGQYAHGNEPSHHIAYLYAYVGQQWKTARLVRKIMDEFYKDAPDGLIGNEDCGQMSAWYIFSSLGFYPVFTASGDYVIGSPLFDKATISLQNDKQFVVETINNTPGNIYIQGMELNGKKYDYSYFNHDEILKGGRLVITMGKLPNYNFGKTTQSRPQEIAQENEYLYKPFQHPGMAQSREDLDYMKQMVLEGKEPWKTAFENLKKQTSLDFKAEAVTHISVGPYGANSSGGREYGRSTSAAYNHALMWYITEDETYAKKAIDILNSFSYQLWDFDENNAKLNVGLSSPSFLNAAEILRHTNAHWSEKDQVQFERLIQTVFYPTIKDFFTEANGNWDASMINAMLCMAIFTDDHKMFNRAVERFYRGTRNSGITKYLYPTGQCQETTRDWDHVQLGIGEFAKAAQTAWTQGLDFYSVADDRLALGFEYASKFMLGGDIPVFGVLSHRKKDRFKDIYESIYDHYSSVKGVELPYTHKVVETQTRAGSSIGMLTSIRKPVARTPGNHLLPVPDKKALHPSKTGAVDKPTAIQPQNAVIVRPGESIQEAIDKNANSDKWIILSEGIHTLKETLKMKSGITLAGQGINSILFLSPEATGQAITNAEKDMHDVVVRDLLIEAAVQTSTSEDPNQDRRLRMYMSAPSRGGILFSADKDGQMKNISLENLTVQNSTRSGISIRGASNVKILACDISDNGSNVVPGAAFHHNLHLTHVANVEIENSRFDTSPWGNGIDLSFSQNIVVSGCEAGRNTLSGIRCADSQNVEVQNCLTEGNDVNGISFETMMDASQQITVNNNLSQNNSQCGIYISKVPQANVENNQLASNKVNFKKDE